MITKVKHKTEIVPSPFSSQINVPRHWKGTKRFLQQARKARTENFSTGKAVLTGTIYNELETVNYDGSPYTLLNGFLLMFPIIFHLYPQQLFCLWMMFYTLHVQSYTCILNQNVINFSLCIYLRFKVVATRMIMYTMYTHTHKYIYIYVQGKHKWSLQFWKFIMKQ